MNAQIAKRVEQSEALRLQYDQDEELRALVDKRDEVTAQVLRAHKQVEQLEQQLCRVQATCGEAREQLNDLLAERDESMPLSVSDDDDDDDDDEQDERFEKGELLSLIQSLVLGSGIDWSRSERLQSIVLHQ
jgi:uncharacterized coiled-coil DUF342 family protein